MRVYDEKAKARDAKYRAAHPERLKALWAKKYAELKDDPERFEAKLARQRAKERAKLASQRELAALRPKPDACELCGKSDCNICLDHCHEHNIFRGWLCYSCNTALGAANDDTALLAKMIDYLNASDPSQFSNETVTLKVLGALRIPFKNIEQKEGADRLDVERI